MAMTSEYELKFMKAVFEGSSDGILVVNHENGAILARNEKFLKIFCIPDGLKTTADDQALLGHVIGTIKNPEQFLSLVSELYEHPERSSHDFIELSDGRTLERHSESVMLDKKILGRVWYFTDITVAKAQEREYQNAQAKMVASSRMAELGQMAGGIAHEINNPLAVIQGKADRLAMLAKAGNLTIDHILGDLKKITMMSERISKIIRGLRTFSRDAERDQMIPTSLASIIEDTLVLCQESLKKNNVDLQFEGVSDLHLSCRASEIGQVLLNLISNAVDATEGLPSKWVRVEASQKNQAIEIKITDSGFGIAPSIVDKIMQPFFTTKELGRGTGLGLSISVGIIRAHGGTLSYDTESKNTCFVIELPALESGVVKPAA